MLEYPVICDGNNHIKMDPHLDQQPTIILASSSPRRRELLGLGGWRYRTISAPVDETLLVGEKPLQYVFRLAEAKAHAGALQASPGGVVISADTIVVDVQSRSAGADELEIMGKPSSEEEATKMLLHLRGHIHQVYTAIAVLQSGNGILYTDICATDVPMRNYSEVEIAAYVDSGDPFDKAGGYAIQHEEFRPVECLYGCYANVVGLPLCHLARTLKKINILPEVNIPIACQHTLHFQCPVYKSIFL